MLPDGRLHLNHGPIDLVIEAWGEPGELRAAYAQAASCFPEILPRLVAELPLLRRAVDATHPGVEGSVARRMLEACRNVISLPRLRGRVGEGAIRHAEASTASSQRPLPCPPPRAGEGDCVFITPMAAVAGAVADHVLEAMRAGRTLAKAYVNDGGDIACHVAPGESLRAGIVGDVHHPALDALATITPESPVRGIATSGWAGRSFSLGIADAATVLARNAAEADAAATLVANAVDIEDHAIRRMPARALDPDSDLGERLVTVAVGGLDAASVGRALDRGAACAEQLRRAGRIAGAVLLCRGQVRVIA